VYQMSAGLMLVAETWNLLYISVWQLLGISLLTSLAEPQRDVAPVPDFTTPASTVPDRPLYV
jgi:hypothetical protein